MRIITSRINVMAPSGVGDADLPRTKVRQSASRLGIVVAGILLSSWGCSGVASTTIQVPHHTITVVTVKQNPVWYASDQETFAYDEDGHPVQALKASEKSLSDYGAALSTLLGFGLGKL